ncbi:transglycosylase SLT domain-containing protein [Halobacteriovorax sp.]|uniref:transglycosylase SLT domain-containing protein n=1 Tax=Halobacteriovorax sp. TaxID=2020862 RepID=UPI00356B287F
MKYFLFLLIFIFSRSIFASSEFVSVKSDEVVEVIQNGKKSYLRSGDLIQIKEVDGWKRAIRIITTISPGINTGDAFIGESTYNDHLTDGNLSQVSLKPKSHYITKAIEVEIYNGAKVQLSPGDEIRVLEVDGWKRKIEIINSKTGIKGSAVIGNNTYLGYLNSNVISKKTPVKKTFAKQEEYEYDSLDSLIQRLMNYDGEGDSVDDEELSSGVEVSSVTTSCPQVGKAYKIDRFINVQSKGDKTLGVPKGSTISVKSSGSSCSIEVLELPKESNLNIKIYSPSVKTFPSNLNSDFLTEVQRPSESVKLGPGVKFKLDKNSSVHAYGRRTGKRYKLEPKDTLKVVGKHRNGDYIVTRNGEKWEYRIPYEDLDELNDNAQLSVNLMDSATNILTDNSLEEAVNTVSAEYDCTDDVRENYEDVPLEATDIEWQTCRLKNSKNSRGKTLQANDYMDKELKLKNSDINKILEVPEKRRFAKCISSSLRHGTNRSSNPSCAKDSKGNIIPKRIRQATYSKKSGKKRFAGWRLLNKAPKACASKELSSHLADRFVDMTKCLGVDAKELFPIINHESHFQPKTISPTFALGVGQIVSVNYMDFYNKLNQAKSMIKSNSRVLNYAKPFSTKEGYRAYEDSPSRSKKVSRLTAFFLSDLKDKMTGNQKECKGLKNIYDNPLTLPSSAKKSASKVNEYLRARENERLCSPKNPDEGFYMAAVYYMYNKKYFTYMLEKENKENKLNMTAKQIKDFSIILARWSYNGGVAGVSGPFERLVQKLKKGTIESLDKNNNPIGNKKRKVSGFSNFSNDDFKSYMSYVIKHRYKGGNARRLEVARYVAGSNGVGGIDGDLKQVEKGEENSCGTTY